MNTYNAKEQLLDIKATFDSLGIPFWLREGTLLAAVRDGEFFDWDHDMDISMLAWDWTPDICSHFASFSCIPLKHALNRVTGFDLRRTSDVRTNVMLQFYNPEEDVYLTLSPPYGGAMRTAIPCDFLDTPNYIDFLGTEFRIPRYPEMVLQSIYGDWHKLVKSGVPWRETWGEVGMGRYMEGIV